MQRAHRRPRTANRAALAGTLPRRKPEAGIPFPAPVTQQRAESTNRGGAPTQSSIRIGKLLFPRQHPDFLGMQVVASALGGYFGSRLMQNLREEHGYTYGVVAAMVNFEREGYFAVAAQVGTEVTQDALREIYTEIERLRAEPMAEGELSLVKNIMVGEMMRILDGPFGIADVTIENILCGRDHTVINENIRRIQAMTPADVQLLARKYLSREELVTVIAGDPSTPVHCGCVAMLRPPNGMKKSTGLPVAFPASSPIHCPPFGPASDDSNPHQNCGIRRPKAAIISGWPRPSRSAARNRRPRAARRAA